MVPVGMNCDIVLRLVLVASSAGCSGFARAEWEYPKPTPQNRSPLVNAALIVAPLEDSRPRMNLDLMALRWVPVMPVGLEQLDRPEPGGESRDLLWSILERSTSLPEAITHAIELEIRSAAIFEAVSPPDDARPGEFTLRTRVERTRYSAVEYTYGASVLAPFLHLVLPYGEVRNEVSIAFSLERSDRMEEVWNGSFRREHRTGPVQRFVWSRPVFIGDLPTEYAFGDLVRQILQEELIPSLEALAPDLRSVKTVGAAGTKTGTVAVFPKAGT